MNKQVKKSGFAHLIIIAIVLGLGLIVSLGYIFYQNYIQSKEVSNKNTTSSSSLSKKTVDENAVVLDKSVTENVTGENLTLDYPSSWIVDSKTALNPSQETSNTKTFITSPDSNIKITFWAGIDGIGGTCGDPESVIDSLKTYPISGYSGHTLYEAISSSSPSDNWAINEVLSDNDSIKIGGSVCAFGIGVFEAANGTLNQLYISFENSLALNNPSVDDINNARGTDNYKTAVKIVQSLHRK